MVILINIIWIQGTESFWGRDCIYYTPSSSFRGNGLLLTHTVPTRHNVSKFQHQHKCKRDLARPFRKHSLPADSLPILPTRHVISILNATHTCAHVLYINSARIVFSLMWFCGFCFRVLVVQSNSVTAPLFGVINTRVKAGVAKNWIFFFIFGCTFIYS
jgi:hypothetical protein